MNKRTFVLTTVVFLSVLALWNAQPATGGYVAFTGGGTPSTWPVTLTSDTTTTIVTATQNFTACNYYVWHGQADNWNDIRQQMMSEIDYFRQRDGNPP
jgi:hypothetical protein